MKHIRVQDVWKDGNDIYRQMSSNSPCMEIHRAVNYYYNGAIQSGGGDTMTG